MTRLSPTTIKLLACTFVIALATGCTDKGPATPPPATGEKQTPTAAPRGAAKKGDKPTQALESDDKSP